MEQKDKIELIANITLIIIGLLLGVCFIDNKILSIVGFSIALASILYQFLGGINSSNSFKLGAIKFGGSAAILIGFMFFFDQTLYNEIEELIVDPPQDWIPVNINTGEVIEVRINKEKTYPIDNTYKNLRKKINCQLSELKNGKFSIEIESNGDTIGVINNFRTKSLFDSLRKSDEPLIKVFTLYPDREKGNTTKDISEVDFPFEIKVWTSWFSVPGYIDKKEVVPRTSWLIPYSDKTFYVVYLEQANSMRDTVENYSKWIVGKFHKELTK